jgi:hypothetical protein
MALSKERKSQAMKGALKGLVSELGSLNVDRAKKKKQKMPMKGMPKDMGGHH